MRFSKLALVAGFFALAMPVFAADVTPFKDTSRVVVIGGSLLEIVYALGEEGHVVARDTTGVFPAAATALPDVGYMRALSPEGVLAQQPSGLLIINGSGPPEALDVLKSGSVPVVSVPESYSRAGIVEKVRTVGAALGALDKAEALITKLDAQMQAAEALTAAIPEGERLKVLFIISMADNKVRAAGSGTAAGAVIGLAGGINPLTEMHGYQTLTDEAVLEASPDVILMMSNSGPGDFTGQLKTNVALAASPAMVNGRVLSIDGAFLLGFGPRTPAAIGELARDLYGDKAK